MRFKISDGDLIIIKHILYRDQAAQTLRSNLERWINARGLQDVRIVLSDSLPQGENNVASPIELIILSVNDVFEDTVLGAKNG